MKKLPIFLFTILSASSAFAGAKLVNVQGKLTSSTGTALSGNQTLIFRLYDVSTAPVSAKIWIDTMTVTLSSGMFNVALGSGASLDALPFNKTYWLGIQVSTESEMTPRQVLGAASYALGSTGDFRAGGNLTVAGSLGVGTSTPTYKLHVSGAQLYLVNAGNTELMTTNTNGNVTGGMQALSSQSVRLGSMTNWPLELATNNVPRLTLTTTGYVGIGTAAPESALHINSSGDYTATFVKPSTDANAWVKIANDARSYLVGLRGDEADNFVLYDNSAGSDRLVLSNSGNVGIGTSSPAAGRLVVNGAVGSPARVVALESSNADDNSWRWVDFVRQGTDSEFIVYGNGDVRADGSIAGGGADYAEYFYSDSTDLIPGEAVCVTGGRKVVRCVEKGVPIGLVSEKPAVLGVLSGDATKSYQEYEKNPHWVKVGLIGQITSKVSVSRGVVVAGDQLTIGAAGTLVKGMSPQTLRIIALEDAQNDGKILVLIK